MVLRELMVKLGLDVEKKDFAEGEARVGALRHLGELAVDAIKDMGKEFINSAKEAIEYGDHIKKTSQSIGIATDALQELQYAAKLSDVSADEMSAAIGKLSMNMQHAKDGSEEASKAFKGIAFKQANGELKNTDEVIGAIADRFAKMPDGAAKTAQAMQLFGRAGKQLIPFLNDGSKGINELKQEAQDLGLVMGGEALDASEKLNDDLERLTAVSQGLWRQAIAPLLPELSKLVKAFLEWRKANAAELAKKIAAGIKILITVVKGAGEVFKTLIWNIGNLMKFLGTAGHNIVDIFMSLGAVGKTVAIALGAAFAIAMAPMVALAALIGGIYLIFDDIAHYNAGKPSLYGDFKKAIDGWAKENPNDPFWLRWIKDFVRFIQQAIELKKEFDEATGNVDPKEVDRKSGRSSKEIQAQADAMTIQSARVRASQGQDLTPAAKDALARSGVDAAAFDAKYRQSPAQLQSGGGGGSSTTVVAPVNISVTQQPGQSGADLASQIQDHIDEHWESQMSSTAAGVSY